MAAWLPLAVDAVSFAAGSALVASIRGHFGPAPAHAGPAGLRSEIAEGLRWLAGHRVLRATAAMVVVNLLAMAGSAVMVLFAQERLGLDAVGFGLLLGGSAVGGVLGNSVAARSAGVRHGPILVGTMILSAWPSWCSACSNLQAAGVMFGLVGFLTVVFNVVMESPRQALTPDRLLGG